MAGVGLVILAGSSAVAAPALNVPKYDGNFTWIPVGTVPPAFLNGPGKAKAVQFNITFAKDVKFKKGAKGYPWFTFLLADQVGPDWKWNQTKGYGPVDVARGVIKAGKHTVTIPLAGIPVSSLKAKKQLIRLGPGTSGLDKPIAFTIDGWKLK